MFLLSTRPDAAPGRPRGTVEKVAGIRAEPYPPPPYARVKGDPRRTTEQFRSELDIDVIGPVIAIQAFGPLLGVDPQLSGAEGTYRDDLVGRRQKRQPAVDRGAPIRQWRRPLLRSPA